jgi:hypothetical protein
VAHTCNPSYSEAEIRRIVNPNQAQANSSQNLETYLGKHWWSSSRYRPCVQNPILKKKKKKKTNTQVKKGLAE